MSTPPSLHLKRVTCERGGRALFRELNLQLSAGQLLRVEGANGAGKTSLLRLMAGLLTPDEGEVLWQGMPIQRQREAYGQAMLYLGHAAALKDDLHPLENLQTTCALGAQAVSRTQALQALADAGLRGFERTPVRRLSQGQRRRCGLARLLLARSHALWVLDEPFNALDVQATAWLEGLIRQQLQRGTAVVLTSHQGLGLDDLPAQRVAL